jgi:hypothetical protein
VRLVPQYNTKKGQGTLFQQAQLLLSNHRSYYFALSGALTLAFIELLVNNVNNQGFNVSLVVHFFVKNLLGQKI